MSQTDIMKILRENYKRMLLTKSEVANEIGGVSEATVDRLRKDGLIESKKILGGIMFSIDEVARFISEA